MLCVGEFFDLLRSANLRCRVLFAQSMDAPGVTTDNDGNSASVQNARDVGSVGRLRRESLGEGGEHQQLTQKEMEVIRSLDRYETTRKTTTEPNCAWLCVNDKCTRLQVNYLYIYITISMGLIKKE